MNRDTGRLLRRTGLLLETLAMLGIISLRRQKGGELATFGGMHAGHLMIAGLAIGVAFWIAGTAMIYWPRKTEEPK